MTSFRFRTASDLHAAYREGRTTPSDVADRALEAAARLDRLDPPMRFFIALNADDVRAQAAASTARWRAGSPLGPLDGVPVAIKDEFDVRGYRTTCGTSFLGSSPATADALVVARLRAAGAVLFGKTNMFEYGVCPSGLNLHHGTARNPFDPARDTGGSSAGSAAAVAAGVVPLALGNDGGGSVRIPAALCGVPGLKATFGRVPMTGVAMLCWSLEHAGPIGSTVEDVLAGLAAVTDERLALPPLTGKSGRLRVGVCEAWWRMADAEVTEVARAALDRLVAAGAARVDVELPHIDYATPIGKATFSVEGAASVEPHLLKGSPMILPVRAVFDLARGLSAPTFVKAQRVRALLARDFDRALEVADVLITPTTGRAAPAYREDALQLGEMDEALVDALIAFTMPLNLTGLPAAQAPCGFTREGLPVGLQIIGPHGADLLTLAAAAEVERASERRRPAVWVDLLEG
jgi:Asp-tRNA(Asn)/Glu-tRNA(Gln) amidotransferase A subunit family amidase